MGSWRLIVDPPGSPAANMAADEEISFRAVRETRPIRRLYRWDRPAVSLGRRQKKEELPPSVTEKSLPMVWRPTGGGAVLHTMDEFTYALALSRANIPSGMPLRELACFLHRRLLDLAARWGWIRPGEVTLFRADPEGPAPVCFSAPARGDLLHQGRKVAGAALRVWSDRVLVQGSIQGFPMWYEQFREAFTRIAEKGFEPEEERDPAVAAGLESYAEGEI